MISVQSLSKSYGNNSVLKNISVNFEAGQITGIVGENGAGKSTLFRCIAGLEAFSGKVNYDGDSLKNTTGFLETHPYMLSKITGQNTSS